jgi:hypothetical protein
VLCAHTVRRIKPGTYDEFISAFPVSEDPPPGWVRFHAMRGLGDENEVITFGFFDGTLEELERNQDEHAYRAMRERIDPLVEQEVANGVYEVVVTRAAPSALAS